ncbi:MAG: transposase, partial [Bacteroidota bacterium]
GATGRSPLPTGPAPKTIGALVAGFKSVVTKRINQMRATLGSPVWQRNYYEHVIRDEKSLNRIREYIITNPQFWRWDEENPERDSDDRFHQWLESFKQRPRGR